VPAVIRLQGVVGGVGRGPGVVGVGSDEELLVLIEAEGEQGAVARREDGNGAVGNELRAEIHAGGDGVPVAYGLVPGQGAEDLALVVGLGLVEEVLRVTGSPGLRAEAGLAGARMAGREVGHDRAIVGGGKLEPKGLGLVGELGGGRGDAQKGEYGGSLHLDHWRRGGGVVIGRVIIDAVGDELVPR